MDVWRSDRVKCKCVVYRLQHVSGDFRCPCREGLGVDIGTNLGPVTMPDVLNCLQPNSVDGLDCAWLHPLQVCD